MMDKQLQVLVVDDTEPNLLLVSKFINKLGHKTTLARNGREAVDRFAAEQFDLVLMDIMMPEMDGYEATSRIRKLCAGKWVPIIFLSAKARDQDQVVGLETGGDDYLSKPVNLVILSAKIKAMQRIAGMQQQIIDNARQLELYRDENEQELRLARHLLEKITHHHHPDPAVFRLWNRPAQHLSGDVCISALTPADEMCILLADGTGHGLSAALNVLPVVDVFYGMVAKGYPVATIAQELNRKIKQLMPTERFVAATLVSVNFAERIVYVWNGGNPPALFVDEAGRLVRTWRSAHPALGILEETDFDPSPEVFRWDRPGQLYVCSDGLPEAHNSEGEEFGRNRLEGILTEGPLETSFERLIQALEIHMGESAAHDDISLGAVLCPSARLPQPLPVAPASSVVAADSLRPRWKIDLRLTAAEIREVDAAPMLLTWMDQLRLSGKHRGQVYVVVTELYNNALDHGILALDSSLKFEADGFERYLTERRRRLATLQQGVLDISAERLCEDERELLKIRVRDSGSGFDPTRLPGAATGHHTRPSGRGLLLVRGLCTALEFSHGGREVTALYELA